MTIKNQDLSFLQNCKFAYGLCLRLAPFYNQFSSMYNFGDPSIFNDCLQALSDSLDNVLEMQSTSQIYIPLLEPSIPDMDDFKSELLPSLGLDAITSILTLLDGIVEKSAGIISNVREISFNSAEFIAASTSEFTKIRPAYNKNSLTAEDHFTEELLKLVVATTDKKSYLTELKALISNHSY